MDEDSLLNKPLVRVVRALALAAHFLVTPAVLFLSILMLVVAETYQARLVAVAVLCLWIASIVLWLLFFENWLRLAKIILLIMIGLGGSAWVGAILARPRGIPPGGNFSQHFSGEAKFRPTAISNLVPEIDQLKLGSYIMGSADSRLAASGTVRLRNLILKIYREASQDKSFSQAGSALGFCYKDVVLGERDLLHFYQYVPRHLKRDHYPVLIFLHGGLGNFAGYTWVLKRFSDQTGVAIIAPTFGAGDWRKDPKCKVVQAVLAYGATQPELDMGRLYLGGISNGGMGVTRVLSRGDTKWAGVVLISPVIESQVIGTENFIKHAKDLPMLIIHGDTDDRIPATAIKQLADELHRNGAVTMERYYPGEDHFLLFSQPDSVVTDVEEWWKSTTEPEQE